MKKITLLILVVNLTILSFSQTNVYWRTDGPSDGKWTWGSSCESGSDGQWYYSDWGGNRQRPDCFGNHDIYFNGNGINTMDLNGLNDYGVRRIFFTSNATTNRILNNSGNRTLWLNANSGNPKIENNSSGSHTFNVPISLTANAELNPVNGNLTFSSINNAGYWIDVWGGVGKTLNLNGIISGTGGLSIKNQTSVIISSASTFSGEIFVQGGGQLEIQQSLSTSQITVENGSKLIINGNLTISSLTINTGGTVEVNAAKQLTISTALTNNGTLTLKSANGVGTATLETPSSISGSGTYNVEQYLSDITLPSSFRNWYISSPVSAAVATVITGTTNNILYERNESNNTYPTATSFVAGRGYVAKIAAGNSNVYTFTGGNLNNGEVTVPISRTTSITKEGFNLVGNPFPAHLKWLQTTADTYGVMTTIWYRTYNSGYSFQTYNAQGDMGVPLDASGYIPPMQAFWVRKIAAGSGNLTLNSTNAVHRSGNPLRAPAQKSGVPNKILRLEVQSNANVDEALIYFNANAANNFDGFDSPKWFNLNDTIPEIYTVADAEKLVINGLNSIQLDTEIPLGFRTGNTNGNHNFKLKATQLQNFGTETELVLIDKGITPTETVLNEGTEYTFNSLAVNSTDRFSLVFRAKGSTTGGCCFGTFENKVRIQKNDNNQLVVNCDNNALKNANLTLYNAAGQKLIEQSITESRTTINLALKTGVYLVKLQTEGKIYNVKVAI